MTSELYYIKGPGVCGNAAFWRKVDGHGYTCDLNEAWQVTRDEARRICQSRPKFDKAYPVAVIDGLAERHLDIQRLSGLGPTTEDPHNEQRRGL